MFGAECLLFVRHISVVVDVLTLSRASPLPHLTEVAPNFAAAIDLMWERACPRKGPTTHHITPTFYTFFMPRLTPRSRSFTASLQTMAPHAAIAVRRRNSMSVLDAGSLLLAVGLFIYLLVALLCADRN